MIDLEKIVAESPLLDEALQAQLVTLLEKITQPVTIKSIIDLEQEKSVEMASFLKVFTGLCENLTLELYDIGEKEMVPELDTTYLPVTGLYKQGEYGRVCFHGVPGGKELNSFIVAIYNLIGVGKEVEKRVAKQIMKLDQKQNVKICVSLACHHCPSVVAACQQIAILNPNIEAEMIDAALYPSLVEQYKIERIPMIIVNNEKIHMGNKTIDEIVNLLKK